MAKGSKRLELAEVRRKALQKFLDEVVIGKMGKNLNWWVNLADVHYNSPNYFLIGKTQSMHQDTYHNLAKALQIDERVLKGEMDLPKVVPLIGYVGAGAEVHIRDNTAPIEYVSAPYGSEKVDDLAALEVQGDSMYPNIQNGDIIYFVFRHEFIEEKCLRGRACVVQVLDGPILVKRITRGSEPGHYTLISDNAPPIENVRIEWAVPVKSHYVPDV